MSKLTFLAFAAEEINEYIIVENVTSTWFSRYNVIYHYEA